MAVLQRHPEVKVIVFYLPEQAEKLAMLEARFSAVCAKIAFSDYRGQVETALRSAAVTPAELNSSAVIDRPSRILICFIDASPELHASTRDFACLIQRRVISDENISRLGPLRVQTVWISDVAPWVSWLQRDAAGFPPPPVRDPLPGRRYRRRMEHETRPVLAAGT